MSDLLNLTQWESHPLYDAPFVAHYQSPLGGKEDPRRWTSKAFSDPTSGQQEVPPPYLGVRLEERAKTLQTW